MPKRKTTSEFSQEVLDLFEGEYVVVGEYVNSKSNIDIRHSVCNSIFSVRPNNLLTGNSRCTVCYPPKAIKTTKEFSEQVLKDSNGEVEFLDEYRGNKVLSKFLCHKCGNTYMARPNSFVNGYRCTRCARKTVGDKLRLKKSDLELKLDSFSKELVGPYVNTHTPIRVLCKIHNLEYETFPRNALAGSGCPVCQAEAISKSNTKSQADFEKQVQELAGESYQVVGKYLDYSSRVEIKHMLCGHVSSIPAGHFLYAGTRCYACTSTSKGNDEVARVLDSLGVSYIREYRVTIHGRLHRYDFFLPEANVFIEYNGIQHYEPVKLFGGEEEFLNRVERDREKHEYAKELGGEVIDIPYYLYNDVERILKETRHIYK